MCMAHDEQHAIFAENEVHDIYENSTLTESMVCHDFSQDLEKNSEL